MRRVLLLFAIVAAPISMAHARGLALQKVSVEQLRQALAALHGKSDKKIAKQLAGVELTERLSRADFDALSKTLPDKQSRTALLALEDASAFLDPPASQVLPDPAPSADEQREILRRSATFAADQADALPAFEAIRTTEHFQDVWVYPYSNKVEYYTPGSFRLLETQTDDVGCSAGGDLVLDQPDKDLDRRLARQPQPLMYMDSAGYHTIWGDLAFYVPNSTPEGLKPSGAFGPWLQAVTGDVPGAKAEWSYWEKKGSGRLAVFSFRIPRSESHYAIEYTFGVDSQNPGFPAGTQFADNPGYHGQIAIDPSTGRVARIIVICDLAPDEPFSRANIELEYGPVKLGESEYVLPLRGVIATSFTLDARHYQYDNWNMDHLQVQTDHVTITSADDLTFSDYRIGEPRRKIVPRLNVLPLNSLNGPAR